MKSREARYTVTTDDGINIGHLYAVSDRLKKMQMFTDDALTFVRKFTEQPNALVYADPPYLIEGTDRSSSSGYRHDTTDELHIGLADKLVGANCMSIICGYQSDMYKELYEDNGWQRVDKEVQANSGSKRTESLWLSPNVVSRLNVDYSDLPIFGEQNEY